MENGACRLTLGQATRLPLATVAVMLGQAWIGNPERYATSSPMKLWVEPLSSRASSEAPPMVTWSWIVSAMRADYGMQGEHRGLSVPIVLALDRIVWGCVVVIWDGVQQEEVFAHLVVAATVPLVTIETQPEAVALLLFGLIEPTYWSSFDRRRGGRELGRR